MINFEVSQDFQVVPMNFKDKNFSYTLCVCVCVSIMIMFSSGYKPYTVGYH